MYPKKNYRSIPTSSLAETNIQVKLPNPFPARGYTKATNQTVHPKSDRRSPLLGTLNLSCIPHHHASIPLYGNTETASKAAIAQINTLRDQYNSPPITYDSRLFALATARVKDMEKYHYYDHVNPTTGECADTLKAQDGLTPNEYVAENALDYGEASLVASHLRPMTDAIDPWFYSRGHRYNLLYSGHISGAVACHLDKCVFLGLNHDRFGEGCTTAANGQQYWDTAPLKPDEIQP